MLYVVDDKSRCKPGDCGIDRKVKPVPKQINKRTLKVEKIIFAILLIMKNLVFMLCNGEIIL